MKTTVVGVFLLCLALSSHSQSFSEILDSDIRGIINANHHLDEQSWVGVNCLGQFGELKKFPNGIIRGTKLPNGASYRLGKVPDPLVEGRMAYLLRVHVNDVLTANGKRCELIAYDTGATGLPHRQEFWYGVSVLPNEGINSQGDDQLILQWKVEGMHPFFLIALRNNYLRAQIRHNSQPAGTPEYTRLETLWRDSKPVARRWMNFVVHARISPYIGDLPFIRIWRDGVLLVDHHGPLGYSAQVGGAYSRIGFYHWVNSENKWDPYTPVRSLLYNKAFIVDDRYGRYDQQAVLDHLRGN